MGASETFTLEALIPEASGLYASIARAIIPRKPLTVSQWADAKRWLTTKSSPKPGRWRTNTNPPLREPMDCMSSRSPVQDVVLMFPIQLGKSEVETNVVGYVMDHAPGPMMVCLPGEISLGKWVNQKLTPMIESSPAVSESLTSTNTRNAANQKEFKDFAGGQLYIEHAGSPQRLKQTTVRYLLVDELTEFAVRLTSGDDPLKMLEGRTSAYPDRAKRMYVSTPGIRGRCRITDLWEKSDQRRYHVSCPHCDHEQPLEWEGLKWSAGGREAWYVCRDCGAIIDEHHKTAMLKDAAAGGTARWIPTYPERPIRGYHINCLYYQIGLGPRWHTLAQDFLEAANEPAKLKTFVNDRLAEAWEDKSMKSVKFNILQDRAEPYRLRCAPAGVLWITAGVDTQDDRLECHIVGWGRERMAWTLDYAVLWGDPQHEDVWDQLTDLLNRSIPHASGVMLPVSATAIDGRGHRTIAVKTYVAKALIRRPMAIFGAKAANAIPLGRPKIEDVTHQGKTLATGVPSYQVGTVAIKHHLFRRLASDHEQADADRRWVHFPDELPREFFAGIVSETFDATKGRYVKKTGARNEPLDTWVYAFAATQHPELHLHRHRQADWDADEARILARSPEMDAAFHAATMVPESDDEDPKFPTAPLRTAPPRRSSRSAYLGR